VSFNRKLGDNYAIRSSLRTVKPDCSAFTHEDESEQRCIA
jgi:hypothetical protein